VGRWVFYYPDCRSPHGLVFVMSQSDLIRLPLDLIGLPSASYSEAGRTNRSVSRPCMSRTLVAQDGARWDSSLFIHHVRYDSHLTGFVPTSTVITVASRQAHGFDLLTFPMDLYHRRHPHRCTRLDVGHRSALVTKARALGELLRTLVGKNDPHMISLAGYSHIDF
jgi:hypothetical protein